MVKNCKTFAYNIKIVFNIKFVVQTSNIKKISENIKSDVITSKVASVVLTNCSHGRRNVGRAGRGRKKLRAMETYEKRKNDCQLSGP